MEDPGSDLSQLDTLTEESILEAVKTRYQKDKIYTSVGDILIAVNPFKELQIYDKKNHEKYGWKDFRTDLPPHVFHVAARAYGRMRQKQSNQIILICGESGAGKTESAKYMVQHFMQMCPGDAGDLHERIIRVNPLLESFGNAKTVMNDNSSRFAKFLELSFRNDGQVTGASIRDYMLEKCRVVGRNEDCGEGNFHIFYGMFAGLSQQEKQDLSLLKPETYSILKGSIERLKMTKHYENQYKENMETLKQIGMTEADKKVMHCMLAAILHLSQIEFHETNNASGKLNIVDKKLLKPAASLLEVNEEEMEHALISSTTIMAGEKIRVYKSLDQAKDGRDALAKHMYERLFGWIVKKINTNLHPDDSSIKTKVAEIGILDIAGFENLQTNSFEQMCINMVNERLQYFMNNVVLIQEKKIYESEEIPFEKVDFKDNMNIIQMFEIGKIGIWPSLDEESKFQQGTDSKFVERLKKNFPKGHAYSPLLTFARGDRIGFGVKHFAGAVWYNCENFLEKNRDTLNKDIEDVMKSSNDDCIADLFSVRKGDTGTISNTHYNIRASRKVPGFGQSIRAKTDQGGLHGVDLGRTLTEKYGKVGKPTELIYMPRDSKTTVSYFQKSISQLLSKMRHAESFFVRCIKPNLQMAPDQLEETLVKGQLKYNGISEICRIRKDGYPSRILIDDFIKRYKPLFSFKTSDNKDMVKTILDGTLPIDLRDKYRIGKHKVFMKESVNSHIERVHFIRQKWAASVIADGLRKNYEIQKKERLKKEQEEREKKRKLEEERKRKKEEEEKNRKTEEQRGKEKERTVGVFMENSVNPQIEKVREEREIEKEKERKHMRKETESNKNAEEQTQNEEGRIQSDVKKSEKRVTFSNNIPSNSSVSLLTTELNSDNGTKKKHPTSTSKQRFWDIFKVIPRERKTQDVHTSRSLRIIKVCAYFILFLMLLASLVIQKISVITLISQLRPEKIWNGESEQSDQVQNNKAKEASACYMFTLLAMCTPYVFMLIGSAWMAVFKNIPFPSFSSIIVCVFIEVLHSIGLCLLVFHLLPDLGAVQGIGLLSAVAIVPSLLKPFSSYSSYTEKKTSTARRKILFFVLDLMAILAQFSAIPIVIIPNTQFIHGNGTHTMDDLVNKYSNESMSAEFSINMPLHSFKVVGALLLCSLSWWENFVDDKICNTIHVPEAFLKLQFDLQESRAIIFLFVSFFKIGISVLFAYLLMQDSLTFGFNEISKYKEIKMYSDILALILSGYVGYYLAYTVCKLQMQRLSFSIPCLLSTPIAIIALLLECNTSLKFVWAVSKRSFTQNCDANIVSPWFHMPLVVLWLLSLYWVAQHIWFPTQERLAKVERLFVNPLYCGILLEQDLVLNRKRHNRRIILDSKENTHVMSATKDNNSNDTEQTDVENIIPPMIYACATMWHENRVEMLQLLKSLFRMDKDQFERKHEYEERKKKETTEGKSLRDTDYYKFEAHIFFDDAFESDDNEESTPNRFVLEFASLMNEAASAVHSKLIEIKPPFVISSHYGGQLIFVMPGNNFIYTHLKDKKEIRHKKRWSQVMYMYYLLGYRIMKECGNIVLDEDELWGDQINERTGRSGKSALFRNLNGAINFKAENTFLLALDGDVDFTPGAVRLLLDRMRKNLSVGAACGRIHPIGSGPMVWYQKFEYAVAHWLQKATEHVLGCVLCSPGCFSMFRGSALMDDNVMKKYTTLATEPSHHLMYDQGEDRWLCTLLLQQGYRVDYAAASDAFTYAPESFNEYFNQRRRWTPSTIANILDLLQDGRNTVASNNNISWLYIVYQGALMVSTIIGPATVLMMIAGALLTVFDISLVTSYVVSLIPAIIFFIICLVFDTKIQLIVAQILSGVYIFIMMVVFVGIVITAVTITPYHPSVIFLSGLVFIFLIAAALHPKEFHNLVFGILYFLWVPSGFLVLVIYSLCNLHVVSWGTREVPKKKTKTELEEEQAERKAKEEQKKKESFWNKFFPFFNLVQELKQTMSEKMSSDKDKEHDALVDILKKINDNLEKINKKKCDRDHGDILHEDTSKKDRKTVKFSDEPQKEGQDHISLKKTYTKEEKQRNRDDMRCPVWIKKIGEYREPLLQMVAEEEDFWKEFVEKYLKPLEKDQKKEKEDTEKLKELRNNVCGGMALINMLWVAINFMFQYKKPTVISIPLSYGNNEEDLVGQSADNVLKVDVVGLMFIIFFLFILLVQFFGMIIHRWGTFMHLIAITEIPTPFRGRKTDKTISVNAEECSTTNLLGEPSKDYSSDEDDYDDDIKEREEKEHFVTQIRNNAETGTKDRAGEMKNMASLRNSTRAKRSSKLRESMKSDNVHGNVNKLSVKEKRQFILAASVREDFLKDLENTKAKKRNLGATRKEREEDLGRSYNRGDDVDTSESGEKIFGIMARERTRKHSNRERKSAQN